MKYSISGGKRSVRKRVAIVHDWLTVYAGAEKVLEQMLGIWPDADVFAVVDCLSEKERAFLGGRRPVTTFLQRMPRIRTHYRSYLPLMPLAIEQLDLSGYDLVLSSSHAVAKGVITGPAQLHVSYVHSPIRYAWDMQHQYLDEAFASAGLKSAVARMVLHYIRQWDVRTANGVDLFVANSGFIARRIEKVYRRNSEVVYPPVDIHRFQPGSEAKEEFYLTASRMVPYKKIPLIVEAFGRMPDKKLVVIGDGPEYEKAVAAGKSNICFLGYQSTEVLIGYMQRARAFVFAAEEDFGITPVEAQACGTPVIAFGRGGALETVVGEGGEATGAFFFEQSVDAICDAVEEFSRVGHYSSGLCRRNAERFSPEVFRRELLALVEREHGSSGNSGLR